MCMPDPALLPSLQSRVHPRTQTPVVSVLFCGCVSAVLALFVPLEELSDLTSMGALFAFCVVCAGVMFRCAGRSNRIVLAMDRMLRVLEDLADLAAHLSANCKV